MKKVINCPCCDKILVEIITDGIMNINDGEVSYVGNVPMGEHKCSRCENVTYTKFLGEGFIEISKDEFVKIQNSNNCLTYIINDYATRRNNGMSITDIKAILPLYKGIYSFVKGVHYKLDIMVEGLILVMEKSLENHNNIK